MDVAGYYTDDSVTAPATRFVPLKQARIVDTRNAIGVGTKTPVGANAAITVPVAAKGGLPAAASISAAVLNITALSPTGAGRWTIYPAGTTAPVVSHGQFTANLPKTNSAITRLASDGRLSLVNASPGTTHYLVDVVGYYTPSMSTTAATLRVQSVMPLRIHDSGATLLAAGATTTVKVAGKGGVPATGVSAAALHVIGAGGGTTGELVAYPPGTSRPAGVTDVVFPTGRNSFNLVWARLDASGSATIVNGTNATIRIYVDLQGYSMAPTAPSTPTTVVGTPQNGAASVSWTAPTVDGDLPMSYEVVASPGGQAATATTTSAVVSGLTNDRQYTFTVRARNVVGSAVSAPSDPVTPTAPKAPGKPFISNVTPRDGAIRVAWDSPPTGPGSVVSYRIVTTPGGASQTVPGTALDGTVAGLTNGTTYRATVFAVNAAGEQASDPSEAVVPVVADVPLAPIFSTAIALSGRADLQWLPPADGGAVVTGYEIEVSPGGQVVTVAPDTTVTSINGLTNGTEYTFSLRARNKTGLSDARLQRLTPTAARVPGQPEGVQTSVSSSGTVALKWDRPTDEGTSAVTGYIVTTSPGGQQITTTTNSGTVTGLDPAGSYTFTVAATNQVGTGQASPPSEPLTPAVDLAVTPVILTEQSMAGARYVHADGTLVFENPTAQVRALKVSDVLVAPSTAKTPRGLLRRVSQVEVQGGLTTIYTVEANLSDVFDDGALAADLVVRDDDLASFVPANSRVRLREATIDGKSLRGGGQRAGSPVQGKAPSIGLRDGAFVLEFDMKSEGKSVDVSMSLKPQIKTKFDIGLGSAETATEVVNKISLSSRATVSSGGFKLEQEMDLGTLKPRCFTVTVGLVPVLVCPELKFSYGFDFTGKLGTTLKVSYAREIGARIESRGEQVSATSINREVGDNGAFVTPSAKVTMSTGPVAKLTVFLMGISGPSVRLQVFTELSADSLGVPWFKVDLGIKLGVGWSGKLFRWKFEWSEDELLVFTKTLLQAEGSFRGLVAEDPPEQIELAATHIFKAAIKGYPEVEPTWRMLSGPGTITPEGVFTASATQMGEVMVEAMTPGGVGRPPLATPVRIRVGPGDPSPPINVKAAPVPLGAEVTWDPGFDGGSALQYYVVRTVPDTGARYVPAGTPRALRLSGLEPFLSYSVSITAVNAQGSSQGSKPTEPLTPLIGVVKLGAATNIAVTATGEADSSATAGETYHPVISDDGRYAIFTAAAWSNLAPAEIKNPNDDRRFLLRKDLETGSITLASRGLDGVTPEAVSQYRHLGVSANGDVVAFVNVTNGYNRILVHSIGTRTSWIASSSTSDILSLQLSASGSVLSTVAPAGNNVLAMRYVKGGGPQPIGEFESGGSEALSRDGRYFGYAFSNYNSATDPALWTTQSRVFDSTTSTTTTIPLGAGVKDVMLSALSYDGSSFTAKVLLTDKRYAVVTKKRTAGAVTSGDAKLHLAEPLDLRVEDLSNDATVMSYTTYDHQAGVRQARVYSYASGVYRSLTSPVASGSYHDYVRLSGDGRFAIWARHCSAPLCNASVMVQRVG
ncbi:fibronectin type III domain-containing protein [Kribbella sp. NBC_01245]|uniref:fibronectin type III domain-containing protein n=1 Tax=Kribbella sp. NBC_01245 TaxID=2903578 RepID=UPI002E287543|nr:fibronectin type III domain-containing protein [Kribbella sp. NBC_01245]